MYSETTLKGSARTAPLPAQPAQHEGSPGFTPRAATCTESLIGALSPDLVDRAQSTAPGRGRTL